MAPGYSTLNLRSMEAMPVKSALHLSRLWFDDRSENVSRMNVLVDDADEVEVVDSLEKAARDRQDQGGTVEVRQSRFEGW